MKEYYEAIKEKHQERVGKNPERIEYAIKKLEENDIEYVLKNKDIGHFHCYKKSDGSLVEYWAGTGKIKGYENPRGIHTLIKILLKEEQ